MQDSTATWAVLAVLVAAFLYKNYLHFSRDVPIEYLTEQSVLSSTRSHNELAVYKSNKLDYSQGLRVGLGILYQHYKVRNGNFNDIWQVFMTGDLGKVVFVGESKEPKLVLNYKVHQIGDFLKLHGVKNLHVRSSSLFIKDIDVLAVVVACFLSQITVVLDLDKEIATDDWTLAETNGLVLQAGGDAYSVAEIIGVRKQKSDFQNEYSVAKDHGIALEIRSRLTSNITTATRFSQVNMVAAVAASIKHLPPGFELASTDRVLIVQDRSTSEGITNGLTKLLSAFLASAHVAVVEEMHELPKFEPTVILAPEKVALTLYEEPSGLERLFYHHRRYALSKLNFSKLRYADRPVFLRNLRLVYAHKSVYNRDVVPRWNDFRAVTCAHVVSEVGHHSVAGPVLLTDYFDFRQVQPPLADHVSFAGCLVQCADFKIVNYDGSTPGDLMIRGFNIGKTSATMAGVGEKPAQPTSDGFFALTSVRARWGSDGCVYVIR